MNYIICYTGYTKEKAKRGFLFAEINSSNKQHYSNIFLRLNFLSYIMSIVIEEITTKVVLVSLIWWQLKFLGIFRYFSTFIFSFSE